MEYKQLYMCTELFSLAQPLLLSCTTSATPCTSSHPCAMLWYGVQVRHIEHKPLFPTDTVRECLSVWGQGVWRRVGNKCDNTQPATEEGSCHLHKTGFILLLFVYYLGLYSQLFE